MVFFCYFKREKCIWIGTLRHVQDRVFSPLRASVMLESRECADWLSFDIVMTQTALPEREQTAKSPNVAVCTNRDQTSRFKEKKKSRKEQDFTSFPESPGVETTGEEPRGTRGLLNLEPFTMAFSTSTEWGCFATCYMLGMDEVCSWWAWNLWAMMTGRWDLPSPPRQPSVVLTHEVPCTFIIPLSSLFLSLPWLFLFLFLLLLLLLSLFLPPYHLTLNCPFMCKYVKGLRKKVYLAHFGSHSLSSSYPSCIQRVIIHCAKNRAYECGVGRHGSPSTPNIQASPTWPSLQWSGTVLADRADASPAGGADLFLAFAVFILHSTVSLLWLMTMTLAMASMG